MKFLLDIISTVYSQEWNGCDTKVTLTSSYQNLIKSSFSSSDCFCPVWRNWSSRLCVHKNETDRKPKNEMILVSTKINVGKEIQTLGWIQNRSLSSNPIKGQIHTNFSPPTVWKWRDAVKKTKCCQTGYWHNAMISSQKYFSLASIK